MCLLQQATRWRVCLSTVICRRQLIAFKSRFVIDKLKKDLSCGFEMKDLGEAKKVLGMEIERD